MPSRALIFIALAVLFFVLPSATGFIVDWLWFAEVGYQPVYLTSLIARTVVGAVVFVIAFLWLAGNLRHALNAASGGPSSFTTREGFTIVLCDLKALLETGASAGMVRDKARLIAAER